MKLRMLQWKKIIEKNVFAEYASRDQSFEFFQSGGLCQGIDSVHKIAPKSKSKPQKQQMGGN